MPDESPPPFDAALLSPSLAASSPTKPLYSMRATFLAAFIGGVYGAALFSYVNSARMGRARRDGWLCIAAAVAWTCVLAWAAGHLAPGGEAPAWMMVTGNAGRTVRNVGKALALVLVGILYLRQRELLRAHELSGAANANAWPLALASMGVSVLLSVAVALVSLAL